MGGKAARASSGSRSVLQSNLNRLVQRRLELADAIRSFTSLPAQIIGLKDRGLIREGYAADLSILDLQNLKINSVYGDPHHYTTGFVYVFVNGVAVVDAGEVTWALPGNVLKRR